MKSPNLPSIVSKYQETIEITQDGDVNGDVQPTPGSLTPHIRACEPPYLKATVVLDVYMHKP